MDSTGNDMGALLRVLETASASAAAGDTPLETEIKVSDVFNGLYQQSDFAETIVRHVASCFKVAADHRRSIGVEQGMLSDIKAVNSQYTADDIAALSLADSDVYVGLTSLKMRALRSWIMDILANAEDRPWTLKATPMPDLSDAAMAVVIEKLQQEITDFGLKGELQDRATDLKFLAKEHTQKTADVAARRAEDHIADIMLESDWRTVFEEFVTDIGTFPSAIIKGPNIRFVNRLQWTGETLEPVSKAIYTFQRVNPIHFYPSPNSTNTQDGAYLIHEVFYSHAELTQVKKLQGVLAAAVEALLTHYPDGTQGIDFSSATVAMDGVQGTDVSAAAPDHTYRVLSYYGTMSGRMLADSGVMANINTDEVYEVELWTCGGFLLRAYLSPHPLGARPFHSASYNKVPGSFWGISLPATIREPQRILNATVRAMVRNMAYSSGPIGEYDADRLQGEVDIASIEPYRMYATRQDRMSIAASQPAIRFQEVPNTAPQLLRVYEYFTKVADEMSGIPAYAMGTPTANGAGRTLGGLSLLMGNAAKGIKAIISSIDRNVIEPVVRDLYHLVVMSSDDASIKADVTVVARGSTGVLQRELTRSSIVEVLTMITPYSQSGIIPEEAMKTVLRDVLSNFGYPNLIPDPARAAQVQNAVSSVAGTPPPVLDRRSALPPDPGDAVRVPQAG